jgi:hypothetical protein
MTPRSGREPEITAGELMARMAQDPEYQAAKAARDAELQKWVDGWRAAEQPIVADLRAAGVAVDSVWDLVKTSEPYPDALPVLMDHLERGGYPDRVMEGMARALAVKPAAPMWDRLRARYDRASGPDELGGLAAALSASATPAQLDGLVELAGDATRGEYRVLFVEPILRLGGERGRAVVQGMREDPVLGAEAAALLDAAT